MSRAKQGTLPPYASCKVSATPRAFGTRALATALLTSGSRLGRLAVVLFCGVVVAAGCGSASQNAPGTITSQLTRQQVVHHKFAVLRHNANELNHQGITMDMFGIAHGDLVVHLDPHSAPDSESVIYGLVGHKFVVLRRNGQHYWS